MRSDSGDYTYHQVPEPATPSYQPMAAAGGHVLPILKTGPERLQIYCDALDRRLEYAERRLAHLELLTAAQRRRWASSSALRWAC